MSYGVLSHRQYGFFMSIQMMWVVPADDAGFFVSCRPCRGRSTFHQCLCCCVFHRGGESSAHAFRASSGLPRRPERRMAGLCIYPSGQNTTKPAGHRQCVPVAWLPVLPVCLRAGHSSYPARRASILGMSVLSSLCVMASVPRPMAKRGT